MRVGDLARHQLLCRETPVCSRCGPRLQAEPQTSRSSGVPRTLLPPPPLCLGSSIHKKERTLPTAQLSARIE